MNSPRWFAAWMGLAAGMLASPTWAQSSTFSTPSAKSDDWGSSSMETPLTSPQERANKRHLGLGLSLAPLIVGGRWEVANGGVLAMDVVWRKAFHRRNEDRQTRIEVGGLGRLGFTPDAVLLGAGLPFRMVFGLDSRFESAVGIELSYTRFLFAEPFFTPRNGFTGTFRWDLGYVIDPAFSLGVSPLALSVIAGDGVKPFVTFEPGVWIRYSPI